MKLNYRIFSADGFVQAEVRGKVTLRGSKHALTRLASDPALPSSLTCLMDFRASHCQMSVVDVFYLMRDLSRENCDSFSRIALVMNPLNAQALGHFVEDTAANRGLFVRSFTKFETARNWLEVDRLGAFETRSISGSRTCSTKH